MSTQSQMEVLSGKLAIELIPKALAGSGIPEPITRIVLETMIGALQEQQNNSDARLMKLVGSYYQSGADYLADARRLQGERREQWIKSALGQFVTASHVEDGLLAAKSQFFVGVCYDLLNESLLASEWYERAYKSAAQFAVRSQQRQELRQLIDSLFPVLFAHGSTLSIAQPIKTLSYAFYSDQGIALYRLQRYQEALTAYEQALRLTPNTAANTAALYNDKGVALNMLGRNQEALAAYEQALRLNRNTAAIYYNKGNALRDLKRYQEALAAYEQAIHLDPNDALAYHHKAVELERLGRKNEAQQFYEKARQLGYE